MPHNDASFIDRLENPDPALNATNKLATLLLLAGSAWIGGCTSAPSQTPQPYTPPIASGFSRVTIERSEEFIAARPVARIKINGTLRAELGRGESYSTDLPVGRYVISVESRPGSPGVSLEQSLAAGMEHRVRVSLDPVRFPAYDDAWRPLKFFRESFSSGDSLRPLFAIQSQGGPRRIRAQQDRSAAERELEAATR